MTDLREKIISELCRLVFELAEPTADGDEINCTENNIHDVADRILALLPKLEWRGSVLYLGGLVVGQVNRLKRGDYYPWLPLATPPMRLCKTESEARAAVKKAVEDALGFEAND